MNIPQERNLLLPDLCNKGLPAVTHIVVLNLLLLELSCCVRESDLLLLELSYCVWESDLLLLELSCCVRESNLLL